ncbi:hypothetical protein [Thioclava kandeliae]|uniref:Uncharacterized protein n=1 Tax=Thioclava kandeliae TaxID=3070818 RepID=A0ABV1SGH9_9RHOB
MNMDTHYVSASALKDIGAYSGPKATILRLTFADGDRLDTICDTKRAEVLQEVDAAMMKGAPEKFLFLDAFAVWHVDQSPDSAASLMAAFNKMLTAGAQASMTAFSERV